MNGARSVSVILLQELWHQEMKIKIHLSFAWTALQLDNDGSDTVGEERIEWEGRGTEFFAKL